MTDIVQLNYKIVVGEILIFNVIGVFGNVNLIWTTVRKKDLQTKPGIILALIAICHIVCLLSELVNVAYIIRGEPIIRSSCLIFIAPYMFFISAQATLTLTMALDLLTAVLFPIKHMKIPLLPYIVMVSIPSVIYGLFIMVSGIIFRDDAVIPFCNPPLVLIPAISRVWSLSNVIINTCVLIVFILIILVFKYKDRTRAHSEHSRVIRRLKVVAVVFVFSWYICLLGVDIGTLFPIEFRPFMQSNMVFFALLCYSQTFYVCLWRSHTYRKAFAEQLKIMHLPAPNVTPSEVSRARPMLSKHTTSRI